MSLLRNSVIVGGATFLVGSAFMEIGKADSKSDIGKWPYVATFLSGALGFYLLKQNFIPVPKALELNAESFDADSLKGRWEEGTTRIVHGVSVTKSRYGDGEKPQYRASYNGYSCRIFYEGVAFYLPCWMYHGYGGVGRGGCFKNPMEAILDFKMRAEGGFQQISHQRDSFSADGDEDLDIHSGSYHGRKKSKYDGVSYISPQLDKTDQLKCKCGFRKEFHYPYSCYSCGPEAHRGKGKIVGFTTNGRIIWRDLCTGKYMVDTDGKTDIDLFNSIHQCKEADWLVKRKKCKRPYCTKPIIVEFGDGYCSSRCQAKNEPESYGGGAESFSAENESSSSLQSFAAEVFEADRKIRRRTRWTWTKRK